MTSEVQHIITVSLNKIMASRHRKGGINLYRNLLVASVLLRAKDAYVAETVAKRKRDMDAEAVVPSFDTTPLEEELPEEMEDMETDISSISESDISCVQSSDKLDESKTSYECDNSEKYDDEFQNELENSKFYEEQLEKVSELENEDEECDNVTVIVNAESLVQPPSRCNRKRRTCELDSQIVDCSSDCNRSCDTNVNENSSCDSSEYVAEEPCKKRAKLDTPNDYSFNTPDYERTTSQSYTNSQTDLENEWDYSDGDSSNDESDEDDIITSHSEYDVSNCYSSMYSSDSQTFAPQVDLSRSSMLIATM